MARYQNSQADSQNDQKNRPRQEWAIGSQEQNSSEKTFSLSLTPKQKEVLDYILGFRSEKGYAPSQQEIATHFGFRSLGTVQNYLVRLQRQGALEKTWNARRGLMPRQSSQNPTPSINPPQIIDETVPLPLVGQVAAGKPIEAIQNSESFNVPANMIKKGQHFVLKVNGDSMIEDGILDGDHVIIKKQGIAYNGQTVVALINNEATIKKFFHRGSRVELHPANPAYQPLVVDSEGSDFKIEGVLVGLIRHLS